MIFGLAILFDLILGSKQLAGWLPSIDKIFVEFASFFKRKLDRTNRSNGERFVRGVIVVLAILPALFLLGKWLLPLSLQNGVTEAISMLALMPLIGQRKHWDNLLGKEDTPEQEAATQSLVIGFADNIIVNGILFAAGGFALLLPYRFLRAQISYTPAVYAERPQSPYLALSWRLAELLALAGSLLASFLLALAHIFIPGTRLSALIGLFAYRNAAMPSRFWPLSVAARGLGLSFRFSATKGKQWIGANEGRARQNNSDRRRVALLLVAAMLLAILVSTMLLTATFTR